MPNKDKEEVGCRGLPPSADFDAFESPFVGLLRRKRFAEAMALLLALSPAKVDLELHPAGLFVLTELLEWSFYFWKNKRKNTLGFRFQMKLTQFVMTSAPHTSCGRTVFFFFLLYSDF